MFFAELVQDQLSPLAQESQMLSLYKNLATRLQRNEKGATAVEYGIMVALIAVAIIIAVTLLGTTLTDMFNSTACSVKGGTMSAATATPPSTCSK